MRTHPVSSTLFPRPQSLRLLSPTVSSVHESGASTLFSAQPSVGLRGVRPDSDVAMRLLRALSCLGFANVRCLGFGEQPAFAEVDVAFSTQADARPESYQIRSNAGRVFITASDERGAFYAACTLRQLLRTLPTRDGGVELPDLEIEDFPDFPARGVMLDVSRDRVPTMPTLLALVDELASLKLNQLQLYMEHTFAYSAHRTVWEHSSPFAAQEIRDLDAYCRDRYIELVPNQNSMGHMSRWLKHAEYKHLAECPDGFEHSWNPSGEPWGLCATDPQSIEFLDALYSELLPNFSSKLFNVGLDETLDLGAGRSKAVCAERGNARVYLDFVLKLNEVVNRHGKRMQLWGDIIIKSPELVPELPQNAFALEWGYEADHPFGEHLAAFARAGLDFYVCPGTSSWNALGGRTDNALHNLASAAREGRAHGATGFLNTDWGDNGHFQPPAVSQLGYVAGAGLCWNANDAARLDKLDLPLALDLHAFGDTAGILGRAAFDLGNVYRLTDALTQNGSILFWTLISDDRPFRGHDVKSASLKKAGEEAARIAATLSAAEPTLPPGSNAAEELRWAAEAMHFACRLGVARLESNATQMSDIPSSVRQTLRSELATLIQRHRANWLKVSRPGGLMQSAGRLVKTLERLSG